jgi:hypothetical protein
MLRNLPVTGLIAKAAHDDHLDFTHPRCIVAWSWSMVTLSERSKRVNQAIKQEDR